MNTQRFVTELEHIFTAAGLNPPAAAPWPMKGAAEKKRMAKEKIFLEFLDAGVPRGLAWMEGQRHLKYRPDRILPDCRGILVTGISYRREDVTDHPPPGSGLVAMYARGLDYHKELKERFKTVVRELSRLHPDHNFRAFTDTGPLDEVWAAEAAGFAFTGRHGLTIHHRMGSWMFLGHILTTFPVPPIRTEQGLLSCPKDCRLCLEACPTGALEEGGKFRAERCLSYLSIEHPGPFPEALRAPATNRIFGCDTCQKACPLGRLSIPAEATSFLEDRAGPFLKLSELFKLDGEEAFKTRFAGSPLLRAGWKGLLRNACVTAANLRAVELFPFIARWTHDPEVGEHARWTLKILSGGK